MRDHRLLTPATIEDARLHAEALGALALSDGTDDAREALARWWAQIESPRVTPSHLVLLDVAVPEWLRAATSALVRGELAGRAATGLDRRAHMLLAEVAAHDLLRRPSKEAVSRAELVVSHVGWATLDHLERSLHSLSKDMPAAAAALAVVLANPANYQGPPRTGGRVDRESPRGLFDDDRLDLPWFPEDLWPVRLLAALDLGHFCALIDALPSRAHASTAFGMAHFDQDGAAIVDLIGRSPVALDASGVATGSVVATFAAMAAVDFACAIARAIEGRRFYGPTSDSDAIDAELASALGAELPAFFTKAWRALLGRSDGVPLAVAMFDELAHRLTWRTNHTFRRDVHDVAASTLKVLLREPGIARAAFPGLARARPGASSASEGGTAWAHAEGRRLVAALRLFEDSASGDLAESLIAWASKLLVQRDPYLVFLTRQEQEERSAVAKRLGTLVCALPEPEVRWDEVRRALLPQRRREEFAASRYDSDAGAANELWLRTGLWVAHGLEEGGAGRRLYEKIFDLARRAYLVGARQSNEHARHLLAECFAHVPTLFGNDRGRALAACFAAIGDDPDVLVPAAAFAVTNSVTVREIEDALPSGIRLREVLDRAKLWAEHLAGERSLPAGTADVEEALKRQSPADSGERPPDALG